MVTSAIIGGIISAVAGIGSAVIGSRAAGDAADAQVAASNQAAQLQLQTSREQISFLERAAAQGRADIEPWRQVGGSALFELADLYGLSRPADLSGAVLGPDVPVSAQEAAARPVFGSSEGLDPTIPADFKFNDDLSEGLKNFFSRGGIEALGGTSPVQAAGSPSATNAASTVSPVQALGAPAPRTTGNAPLDSFLKTFLSGGNTSELARDAVWRWAAGLSPADKQLARGLIVEGNPLLAKMGYPLCRQHMI